ncbi:MAG: nucleotidyltransferase family protein [Maricaulaceae bacterium]
MSRAPTELLAQIKAQSAELEARYGLKMLGLVGSHARGTAGPHSDVDILVDVVGEPNYLDIAQAELAQGNAIGRSIDLLIARALPEERREAMERSLVAFS